MTKRGHLTALSWALTLALGASVAACTVAEIDSPDTSRASDAADAATDAADAFTDRIDATCTNPNFVPSVCLTGAASHTDQVSASHVLEPTPITYDADPPSSGAHRPAWAKWGEYDYLPPQRWLHNLEHGGIALLYNPCVDEATIEGLRAFAAARPDDETGAFRYVLTPYVGLPSDVAAVAWEETWTSACADPAEGTSLEAFVDMHYRTAPEDVAGDGSYDEGWIAR